jgi:dTDP-glucose pyrophosphorylase
LNPSEGRWRQAILPASATIELAIRNLDQTAIKIVLVADESGVLQGTVSDGDIRRGLLKGLNLASSIAAVVHRDALVVPPGMRRNLVMQLMAANMIQQVPIVDECRRIVGLHLWDEITTTPTRPNMMIIMAGGMGTRLRPHTENCPKPMLPIAGKPMLEHIIERGRSDGFRHFVLAIHYLGHMVEDHFGNGAKWNVDINYLREQAPLGTAGALGLLERRPTEPFLVTNGDVLTDIHYGEMLDFHSRHLAAATMAVRLHEWQHPFGVVKTKGVDIIGFEEKPISYNHINAGIYVLEPRTLDLLRRDAPCDMPTLFERLQLKAERAIAYPMHEPWLDVGRPDDLKLARDAHADGQ